MKNFPWFLWAMAIAVAGLAAACSGTVNQCLDSEVKPLCGHWKTSYSNIANKPEHMTEEDEFSIENDLGALVARPLTDRLKKVWPARISLTKRKIDGKVCLSSLVDLQHSEHGNKVKKKHLIFFYMGKDMQNNDELVACFSQDNLTVDKCKCANPGYHAGAAHSHPPT